MTKAEKAVFEKYDLDVTVAICARKHAEVELRRTQRKEIQACAAMSALIEYVNCKADAKANAELRRVFKKAAGKCRRKK